MFSKLFAVFIIVVVVYIGLVFVYPEVADQYGSPTFNEQLRMLKRSSELDRNLSNTGTLIENAMNIAKPYIDESKNLVKEGEKTIEGANTLMNEKTEQAKDALKTTKDAIDKVGEAKSKIETLTQFGTGK